jgi:transcriptional regulator with XRE-family HTH domain
MFGDRLREVMTAKGLTQADVARLIGMSRAVVSSWLSGKYGPHWSTVVVLAEALGVSTEVFRFDVGLPDVVAVPVGRKRGRPRKDNKDG